MLSNSLFSLLSSSSSSPTRSGRRRAPTRRSAVVDGGTAPNAFFFLYFFRAYSSIPSSLFTSGLKTSKIFTKTPRSKKRRKEIYTFWFFFWIPIQMFETWGRLWLWFCAWMFGFDDEGFSFVCVRNGCVRGDLSLLCVWDSVVIYEIYRFYCWWIVEWLSRLCCVVSVFVLLFAVFFVFCRFIYREESWPPRVWGKWD